MGAYSFAFGVMVVGAELSEPPPTPLPSGHFKDARQEATGLLPSAPAGLVSQCC